MASWFGFGKKKDEERIETFKNINELDSFKRAKGIATSEGDPESGTTPGVFATPRREKEAREAMDVRVHLMDVNDISALTKRFGKEFETADRQMAEKVKLDKKTFLYDYDQDKRFQVWKEDRKKAEERLHIHWIDNVIDRPLTAMVYFLRVFTTVGLFYGLGRTAYLYRTMDRTYAKLNGVSIGKILFEEVSFNVAKGGGVAAVSALSIPLGDSTSKMIRTAYRGEVYAPQREWYDVVSSFTMGGFAAGGTFAAIERQVFSPRGMLFLIGGGTLAGLAAGFFLGYSVYRPVAEKRKTEGGLYERPWKNWSNLYVASGGPAYMRGKYTWSHGGREEP